MEYCSIGELCFITKGSTGIMKAVPGPYPLVTTGPDRKSSNEYEFDDEAVCIPLVSSTGHGHKSLNYIHYQSGKFALGSILAAVIPKDKSVLSAEYLQRYLFFFKDRLVVSLMKGAANVSLAIKDIAKIKVPVPPISKQKEFIELFNKAESGKYDLLFENQKQSTCLTKLRQAILQEAIEGKLTAGWRKENPFRKGDPDYDAKALLEKINEEKEKLIKEGKIRKTNTLAPIMTEEMQFTLTKNWEYVRTEDICIISTGKMDANEGDDRGLYNFYTCAQEPIKSNTFSFYGKCLILPGNGANVGFSRLVNEMFEAYQRTYVLTDFIRVLPEYIHVVYKGLWKNCLGTQYGSAINYIRLANITDFIIPLPPLAEQQAIVDRVEKLLSMVDELEKQVFERKEQSEQLMQAVLREAFEGGNHA